MDRVCLFEEQRDIACIGEIERNLTRKIAFSTFMCSMLENL